MADTTYHSRFGGLWIDESKSRPSYFEKKKQKAFICAVADLSGVVRVSADKSFLLLFFPRIQLASA
jgi:hypothetical protein